MFRIFKFLRIIIFLKGVGGVLRESINKTQGGKILSNNTQKYCNTNFTVWECSYSIGSQIILMGGG